jgi:hypothetical protein
MKTLKKIGLGVALASSTLALSAVGMSSAQAAVLGTVNIIGGSTINLVTNQITFRDGVVINDPLSPPDSFTPLTGTAAILGTITLSNPVVDTTFTTYTGNTLSPFITLDGGNITFVADNPLDVSVFTLPNGLAAVAPINGIFTNATGDSIGRGVATINDIANNGSFSLSLQATPPTDIPEPTTTLGLAALGLGAFFTNSLAKKKKEKVNA